MIENKMKPNKKFGEKKKYTNPTLRKMGKMQRVTMGGTSVVGDSGGTALTESPTKSTTSSWT